MERVTAFLIIFSMKLAIHSFPIENGFSLKFNPISAKEELKPKKFGSSFAKIPQNFNVEAEVRRDVLTKPYFSRKAETPTGYSNQVAKLLFSLPPKYFYNSNNNNETNISENQLSFLNLPILKQPYDNYKILVATAPPNVHLGGDDKQTVMYVVFPDEEDTGVYNIPTIYFVNKKGGKIKPPKKVSDDPILIVDSNRTVTGLKSKEVSKFVKFKSKLSNRYNYAYNVTR